MKTLLWAVCFVCLVSCRSVKYVPVESHDSTRIETRTEVVYVTDSIYITIPEQSAERVTGDNVSILENDFAISVARIDSAGMLHHTLDSKPQELPVEVEKKEVRTDSVVYIEKHVPQPYPVEVEVEKELTWWQQARMKLGTFAIVAIVSAAGIGIFRLVRKLRK